MLSRRGRSRKEGKKVQNQAVPRAFVVIRTPSPWENSARGIQKMMTSFQDGRRGSHGLAAFELMPTYPVGCLQKTIPGM